MSFCKKCRICKNTNLDNVIFLGDQYITSRFPKFGDFSTQKTDITLCLCNNCYLLQLRYQTHSSELYEFEFIPELDFDSDLMCESFLKFIAFLQFNYIKEISLIITDMDFRLMKRDLDLFLEKYSDEIISKIDFLVDNHKFSMLISKFFRTNNKDNIIKFLKPRLQKDKMIIILETMKGENKDEEGIDESS